MEKIEQLGRYASSVGCETRISEPMILHTTFRIGGPADLFVTAPNAGALKDFLNMAAQLNIRVTAVGNGSNLLVSDAGIRGAVITFGGDLKKIRLLSPTELEAGTGASLANVCAFARDHVLSGLEFAWGIPGSAGGAAFMDAGAYGHSMAEVVTSCLHVGPDCREGEISGEALDFGYRHSAYSGNGCLITAIRYKLSPGNADAIAARMAELWEKRKTKQPLEFPSAGSVFKRPEGHFAGALIEQCGLKGHRVGGAQVSEKHAGFIINTGGATCTDVQSLITLIQETVFRETGVHLECEIRTAE